MHLYVLFVRPARRSFTGRLLEGLSEAGHGFELDDLCAEGFTPNLDAAPFARKTTLDAEGSLGFDAMREHARLEAAKGLGFIRDEAARLPRPRKAGGV